MSTALTVEGLKVILGREVDEVVVTVAKSNVMGLDAGTISEVLGVERVEIDELMQTQDYKDVRLLIGAEEAKNKVERDSGWDGIESKALTKLQRRTELENDTETLLKIAAVANKAVRRTAPRKDHVLDPSQAGTRVPLTLTKRYTEKLQQGVVVERSQIQQISVLDGSAVNPTFHEVSHILQGNAVPAAPNSAPRNAVEYQERVSPVDDDEGVDMNSLLDLAKRLKR